MNLDPNGNSLLLILGGIFVGGLILGISSAISAAEGENRWGAFLGGFVNGAISTAGLAAALATGGAAGFIFAAGSGYLGGLIGDSISQKISYGEVDMNRANSVGIYNAIINTTMLIGINQTGLVEGVTWAKRFIDAVAPSLVGVAATSYFAPFPFPFS